MSDYTITKYSKKKAKELKVIIKPSENPKKKIDVFKDGKKVASIGDIRYPSYPDYLKKDKTIANERRRLYKIRHQHDDKPAGFYADKILW
jgi:hypothetical protein